MFLFLTVIQALIAAALVGVVLMQRSEGGGLGIGGSPTGMLSARGAADFLTKATRWLAILFVALSIALAAMAVKKEGGASLDTTLNRDVQPAKQADPLGPTAGGSNSPASPASQAPANDPLGSPSN